MRNEPKTKLIVFVCGCLFTTLAFAADKSAVASFLETDAQRITARAAAEVSDQATWEKVRVKRLEELRDMLGLLPWPARTPLHPRITGTLDKGDYIIEKLAFESMPKIYVTANLYLPKKRTGRLPAIVYVCGHSFSPQGDKTAYQRHGISFAKNGYVCLILDSIQIAELYGTHHGVMFQEMYDWYSRGYTPAGVEAWSAMRAIDYLETRPEVDKERIGMTGRSGGAAMTWFTAAVDPRVKVAAPVMGLSTYAANLRENTQKRHCDCMFPINFLMHDMMHQAALIAPRPLMMAHGRKDALFPVPGYTEVEQRMSALFTSYGKPEAFRNVVVDTEHKDSDYLREEAIRWFDRFLRGTPDRKLNMDYSDAPAESLAVFGGKPPTDAQNYRLHETFIPTAPFKAYASVAAWEKHKAEVLTALKQKVFSTLSDDNVPIHAVVRRPSQKTGLPGLLYIASEGEDERYIDDLLRAAPNAVRLIVYPRGTNEWSRSEWRDMLRNAMHTGRTVDSMRLRDVIRAVEQLRADKRVDPARIMTLGKGVSGVLGLYAAILDPRIHQVMLMDPPSSHVEGPIFLGILRHLDLPEAAAMIAPRRLNFYARLPASYEATRRIYRLYGKPENVFVSIGIKGPLEGRYDYGFASGY